MKYKQNDKEKEQKNFVVSEGSESKMQNKNTWASFIYH